MNDAPLMHKLKEMILSAELAPGERVTEAGLAERLGVSRTPIRNLLPRLASEGFLRPVGRRGFAVAEFSDDEILDALELRSSLEGWAARRLAKRGASKAVLGELEECLAEGDKIFEKRHLTLADEREYERMNGHFHRIIVEACGSPMLVSFIDRVNMVPFVAPSVVLFDQVGLRRAFELLFVAHGCHHSIVEAIRARDGDRAENLFREHANHQRYSMFARREGRAAQQSLGKTAPAAPKRARRSAN